jgi:hypothetical protein
VLSGHDAMVRANREKTIAARGATIGGKVEQSKQPSKRARAMLS